MKPNPKFTKIEFDELDLSTCKVLGLLDAHKPEMQVHILGNVVAMFVLSHYEDPFEALDEYFTQIKKAVEQNLSRRERVDEH